VPAIIEYIISSIKNGSNVEAWPPHSQRLSRSKRLLNLK